MKTKEVLIYSIVTLVLLGITCIPTTSFRTQLIVLGLSLLGVFSLIGTLLFYEILLKDGNEVYQEIGIIGAIIFVIGLFQWVVSDVNMVGSLLPFTSVVIVVACVIFGVTKGLTIIYKRYQKYPK